MAITKSQENFVQRMAGLRDGRDSVAVQVVANAETQARQLLRAVHERQKMIAESPEDYAGAYGDGSLDTEAATVNAEIAEDDAMVDNLLAFTEKTRADLEVELGYTQPEE